MTTEIPIHEQAAYLLDREAEKPPGGRFAALVASGMIDAEGRFLGPAAERPDPDEPAVRAELDGLQAIVTALESVDAEARDRMLRWVNSRYRAPR